MWTTPVGTFARVLVLGMFSSGWLATGMQGPPPVLLALDVAALALDGLPELATFTVTCCGWCCLGRDKVVV